jgi:putative oxidoreductase
MQAFLTSIPPLLGRVLVAALFLWSGWGKLMHPAPAAARIAARHLPVARPGALLAGFLEVGLGALLLVGLKARPAAVALVGYVAVVSWLFHWDAAMGGDAAQMVQLAKNAAAAGGLLLIASHGAGPAALERG